MSETTVKTEGTTLIIERDIKAPRSKVWAAYTTKELFEKWWGPLGWKTTVKHMDFSVGGYLHYGMHCQDPAQGEWFDKWSWGKSVYKSIDAENGFVYTDYFCDENGTVDEQMPALDIVMRFEEIDGGTKLTSTSDMGSEETLNQMVQMGMIEGIKMTIDRLAELTEEK